MVEELPYILVPIILALTGLWIANTALDRWHLEQYLSRKIAHIGGGLAFVSMPLLFSDVWFPIIATSGFVVLLAGARLWKGVHSFRGTAREGTWAEIYFPLAGIPTLAIVWGIFDEPWLAVAYLSFMAFGDGITGIVRSHVYHKAVKGLWGSAAMLGVCLGIAFLMIDPLWAGIIAALVATTAEWLSGDVGILKKFDDNWTIPIFAMAITLPLIQLYQ